MPKNRVVNKKFACHHTGIGFDSHAYGTKGTLVLGGVRFPGIPALSGHSDGDALLHAVIDAVLGGSSQGDIGQLFPDTSRKWKGASSIKMLRLALQKSAKNGLRPRFLDVTVVADKPKLAPVKTKIRNALARTLRLRINDINVKGKRQEGLRWFGPRGGVAVWAVATMEKNRHDEN